LDGVAHPLALEAHPDRPLGPLVEAWTTFLGRWRWDWFATFTFRNDVAQHPEAADKLFRVWCSKLNRRLHGVRWYKYGDGVRWMRAAEPHKSGKIHFHALVGDDRLALEDPFEWMEVWNKLAGFARIFPPWSSDAALVRAYCSKYVVKGGDLELGGPLRKAFEERFVQLGLHTPHRVKFTSGDRRA
jgi:hypothetical protein